MSTIEIGGNVAPVTRDEVVKLLCDLINIPSVTGTERQIAEFLVSHMRELGLESRLQEISAQLDANGIDSEFPYRNAGSDGLYDFSS